MPPPKLLRLWLQTAERTPCPQDTFSKQKPNRKIIYSVSLASDPDTKKIPAVMELHEIWKLVFTGQGSLHLLQI